MSTNQAEAHATRHHHYDASAQSHEQHHRASRPSYVSYMTLKRPGSPTTVGRTPGHHASTMLREAPICALQAEQVQRVGRSAAPTPHVLRPCMTGALPCCSHDVRQRVCAGGLARQPPKRDVEPPRLAWKWSFPCESEAGSEGKTDTPVVNLNLTLLVSLFHEKSLTSSLQTTALNSTTTPEIWDSCHLRPLL